MKSEILFLHKISGAIGHAVALECKGFRNLIIPSGIFCQVVRKKKEEILTGKYSLET